MFDPLLKKLQHYTDLGKKEVSVLCSAPEKTRQFDKGEHIISEGENPVVVHMMVEGWACRCKMLSDGREQIMGYLIKGDMCDLHVTLLSHMDHSIRTLTSATVAMIPQESIEQIFEDYPRLARALSWSMTVDEAITRHWILNVGLRSAEARVAHLFCEMLLRFQTAGLTSDNTIDMPLTQTNMGEALGLTPVHINRVLQRLRQKNLITLAHKKLVVLDLEGLKEVAEFDDAYLHIR
ncbi:Crp/Fnr family transcriptional regulator [Kushneria pakistanensis]|uniref:Crp/Fnr family transcriptional regulator n=1 Tax=Kushneria pakistanensis TaxID=1508770 RepID=A0ABQ3FI93_9GAMM|nr:Crp/Fnr family transcriptional regulator [Kushneria pakistanensis]GHC25569.1 Crp/Fnr family transcriptional regulator [Kushneria pakistanensis]